MGVVTPSRLVVENCSVMSSSISMVTDGRALIGEMLSVREEVSHQSLVNCSSPPPPPLVRVHVNDSVVVYSMAVVSSCSSWVVISVCDPPLLEEEGGVGGGYSNAL